MVRLQKLETIIKQQNERIDTLFECLFNKCEKCESGNVNNNKLLEEQKDETKKRNIESTADIITNANKKPKHEPLLIESYYEEITLQDPSTIVFEDSQEEKFPFTNLESLRHFNKTLRIQQNADEFVNDVKRSINVVNEQLSEQIVQFVISEQLLKDSTWASKSSGKLRISYLTNLLKCFLRIGRSYNSNFTLEILRSKTIDLIHSIRVRNGLAPPKTNKCFISSV